MANPQPRNLFTTTSFLSLTSSLLIASTPNIGDIVRNGGTIEKYLYLVASVLAGAGVATEKMKKEKDLYTPDWFPAGQNKSDVIAASPVIVPPTPPIVYTPVVDPESQPESTLSKVISIAQNPLNLLKLF